MAERILYTAGVIAVGWAVTFALRSLPFLMFAGRGREVPQFIERFGTIISPIIIAGLIVYSYSGLEWRTAWPYLAGALTVGLQIWKGNPLASIIAGTVLYMCLLNTGCVTSTVAYEQDMSKPLISISPTGIKYKDELVTPEEAVKRLKGDNIPKDATIYVKLEGGYDNQRALWVFKNNYLSRAGYTRSAWVKERRTETGTAGEVSASLEERSFEYRDKTIRPGGQRRVFPRGYNNSRSDGF